MFAKRAFLTPRAVSRAFNLQAPSALIRRSYGRLPTRQISTPVARFTHDYYFDLSGTQFISVSDRQGQPVSVPSEKSARVFLDSPPRHFSENEAEAKRMGVSQCFVSSQRFGASPSELHISFVATTKSLKEYVHERKNRFFQEYPAGWVQDVTLQPGVTDHLRAECAAVVFDPFAQVSANETRRRAQMSLLMRTGDGFWELSWHTQLQDVYHRNTEFVQVVKKLRRVDAPSSDQQQAAAGAIAGSSVSSPAAADSSNAGPKSALP